MTQGTTGSFAINSVDFILQPTEHKWMPRTMLGRDGAGHPIYSGVREYEFRFQLGTLTDYWQLQQWFQLMSNTGTLVLDLPTYGISGAYTFTSYTGCVISEPEAGTYFAEHKTDMTLIASNIRTGNMP
jgi:hypothetical protein